MLEQFVAFMDETTLGGSVLLILVSLVATPGLVFVHELGHALAAKALGQDVAELVVGDTPDVIVRAGRFTMRLGRYLGRGDVGGYVRFGDAGTSAKDLLIVSLAGPAASALAAFALLVLSLRLDGMAAFIVALHALSSAVMAVGNLIPSGDTVDQLSDGRVAQIAWAARRWAPPEPTDPNEATSVAPPGY